MNEATTKSELETVQERVGKGMAWLSENDEHGNFHFWFKAGLTKRSPMPSQPADVIERWHRYYDNRVLWEQLFARMERLEKSNGQKS